MPAISLIPNKVARRPLGGGIWVTGAPLSVWFHTTFLAPYIWSVHTVHNVLVCSARFVASILLACVVSWRCLWHNKCTRVTYGKPWVCNASAALSVSLCHFSFHLESL